MNQRGPWYACLHSNASLGSGNNNINLQFTIYKEKAGATDQDHSASHGSKTKPPGCFDQDQAAPPRRPVRFVTCKL